MGFFETNKTRNRNLSSKGKPLSCASCGAYKTVFHPRMKPFGNFKKKIMNVGEAPGAEEDRKGCQWQGKVGQRLQREYKRLGIDLFEDCVNINAINCRPIDSKGNNRSPTNYEIECCRKRVLKVIDEYKPELIILLGSSAVESVIGWRWKKNLGPISKWRGWAIPDREYNAWVCPTFHPSYIERQQDSPEVETIWREDLKKAFEMREKRMRKWPMAPDEEKAIHFIEIEQLEEKTFPSLIAIDYETTGLKPYAEGHKVICGSVACHEGFVYAFMVPEDSSRWRGFQLLLASRKIGKIAHNMKFEEMWSREYFNQPVEKWEWDTMLASHVIDNRKDINALKLQAYLHFGEAGYDDDISPYIRSGDPKNGNAFNKIPQLAGTETGRRKLMTYCALDSLYTLKLAKIQMGILGREWPKYVEHSL